MSKAEWLWYDGQKWADSPGVLRERWLALFVIGWSSGNFREKGFRRLPREGEGGPVPCGGNVSS